MNPITNTEKLIESIYDSNLMKHKGLAFYVNKALSTGDSTDLRKFLERHPSFLKIINRNIAIAKAQNHFNPFMPYPSKIEIGRDLSGDICLGYVDEKGSKFKVNFDNFSKPSFVMGKPGGGKSRLLYYIVIQFLVSKREVFLLLPDLKHEYRHICTVSSKLKVIDYKHLKINPLEPPEFCQPKRWILIFAKIFVAENYLAGTSENLLIMIVVELYKRNGIFDGSNNYPTMKELYQAIFERITSSRGGRFYDVLNWLLNRVYPYLTIETFGHKHSIPFEVFLNNNIVLELDDYTTDHQYNFIVSIITYQLFLKRKSQGYSDGKLHNLIIADEGRKLSDAHKDLSHFPESTIVDTVTKSRSTGVGFMIASHESSSFNPTYRALADLMIAFHINDANDKKFIKDSFGLTDEQVNYSYRLPQRRVAIVRYGGFERPFVICVPWIRIPRKVSDHELEKRMRSFWESLKPKVQSNQLIVPSAQKTMGVKRQGIVPPDCAMLIFYIYNEPFSTKTDLLNAPGFNSIRKIEQSQTWLKDNGYITLEKYRIKTKPAIFSILTNKAYELLKKKSPVLGKGSFEHCLHQKTISEILLKKGLKPKIEGRMKGNKKQIDVLVKDHENRWIAYEVELSLVSVFSNISQNFAAGVDEVVVVNRDKRDQDRAKKIVANSPTLSKEKVTFRLISNFA